MKTLKNTIAVVAIATLLFSSNLFAQDNASSTAAVNIKILKAISMTSTYNSNDLPDYAAAGNGGGTVTVTPGTINAANFLVQGEASEAITVSYDASVSLAHDGGGAALIFTSNVDQSSDNVNNTGDVADGGIVNLNASGDMNLWVGGSIAILNTSGAGNYTGTFNISVAY
ncbi:MAG: DUF4402 domain-containing protein [Melioribacteraceae bacterium]|jgi:hypothetical protein|nr:DUF4402 domain-containing protein [Melioribacteraceae bacterium]